MAIIHNMLSYQSQLQYLQMLVLYYGWTLGMVSPWGNSSISAWNISSKRETKKLCFLLKVSPEYFIIPEKCSHIPPSLLLFFLIIVSTTQQWQGPWLSLENYCCPTQINRISNDVRSWSYAVSSCIQPGQWNRTQIKGLLKFWER